MTHVLRKNIKRVDARYLFLLEHFRSGNVLDIGNIGGLHGEGNTGFHSKFRQFAETRDSEVFGFDIEHPVTPIHNQTQGDVEEALPYADSFFDTIYLGEVIEHLYDFRRALSNIRRVLKDDGVLILDTPNAYDIKRLAQYFLFGGETTGNPTHTIIFTPASLVSILEKTGLEVTQIAAKGRWETHLLLVARKV
jgi:SAM-dependent methyltransferase